MFFLNNLHNKFLNSYYAHYSKVLYRVLFKRKMYVCENVLYVILKKCGFNEKCDLYFRNKQERKNYILNSYQTTISKRVIKVKGIDNK